MKIKQTLDKHCGEIVDLMVCEHCRHEHRLTRKSTVGCEDDYYHSTVIPTMRCESCGKNRSEKEQHQPNLKFRRRPTEVEAFLWAGDNRKQANWPAWLLAADDDSDFYGVDDRYFLNTGRRLWDYDEVFEGDWLVAHSWPEGDNDGLYCYSRYSDWEFKSMFEPIEEESK
ncbi:MAG: hypothetical protein ACRDAJ_06900 [Serratia fonticola]